MKKYQFVVGDVIEVGEHTLTRIIALRDITVGDKIIAKKGDLGGYIEREENLSHRGGAWVADDAKVYDHAWICGNALVEGEAEVSSSAWVSSEAQIKDKAKVSGKSWISDTAQIKDSAQVSGGAWACNGIQITGDTQIVDGNWVYEL